MPRILSVHGRARRERLAPRFSVITAIYNLELCANS